MILSNYCFFPMLHTLPLALFVCARVARVIHALSVEILLLFSKSENISLYSDSDMIPCLIQISIGKDVIISDS